MGRRPRRSLEDRFWEKVALSGRGGCWSWMAGTGAGGYGCIGLGADNGNRMGLAHRVSYELHFGPIPDGLCVCHKCDNRLCVNPSHFFLGTKSDNNYDMFAKGRNKGPPSHKTSTVRLTELDVMLIRNMHFSRMNCQMIHDRHYPYVTHSTVCRVASHNSWRTI